MSWWLRHIGWWPPLLGTGIRVTRFDKDLRAVDVEMRLKRWNRNYKGVHFGGSLFSMTDPFYMLMLATNLSSFGGREYVVWDKAASIRYRKPRVGRVRAEFRLSEERLAEIRAVLEVEGRYDARFVVEVKDDEGEVVAEVERVVYCAKKSVHEARKKARVVGP
jgi:acyl-coenzyme A thioesterase PaaI-like protein